MFNKFKATAMGCALSLAVAFSLSAQADDEVNNQKGFIAKGYDVTAYFDGTPVEGSEEFKSEYEGGIYLFASAENLAKFEAAPADFAPQYGGWCSFAAAQQRKLPINPEAFKVVDGKLYLNNSKGVHKRWLKKEAGYIRGADNNWPYLKSHARKSLPKAVKGNDKLTRGAIN